MDKFSYLNTSDLVALDQLYKEYLKNPDSVDVSWKQFFEGYEFARKDYDSEKEAEFYPNEFKVINLINAYRQRGHLFTKTNPVRTRRQYTPTLEYENFGLKSEDLNKSFKAGNEIGLENATLQEIIDKLQKTYCQSIGVEFRYMRKPEIVNWLQEKMEGLFNTPNFDKNFKINILTEISQGVLFEKFIHKKFPGQKRFSLEGAEALIPALHAITETGTELGIKEFVIGMAHRGRLNILANILKKPLEDIFHEFEGSEYTDENLMGDVKYHLGFTNDSKTRNGKPVRLTLTPNPSHLEAVNPVVEGISRAKIDSKYKGDFKKLAPILIHGDASIASQGVIYEVLQMSELPGYKVGGTIHVVINNQIGFTTNYLEGRSSTYCTDVAKTTLSPVFHVNGDDVEAVVLTIQLAMEFRQKFHKDVFIDLLCYRRYGHNEGDEPRFTQPILYKLIEKHPNPLEIYRSKLIQEDSISEKEARGIEDGFIETMENSLAASKGIEKSHIDSFLKDIWQDIDKADQHAFDKSPKTSISKADLTRIGEKITEVPDDIKLFRKLEKLQETRRQMLTQKGILDWAMGELLAYGSLVDEGVPVRFSGQDSARGTFSHRHAVLKVENSELEYIPLNHISKGQARFEIYNSPLSEFGVLGFEYGYSLSSPYTLTIWEAQFGDFANSAQVIFDQFLSSAEDKWNVMNDLVILLPHGYEGQGPEHSSARMERMLLLSSDNNLQIANCTSPASFFHIIRRQLKRSFRKPLIILTPKSLLRHPDVVSPLSDFTNANFKEIIDDEKANVARIKRVIFCTGKVYYDLLEEKNKEKIIDTAIIRMEQLAPLPIKQLKGIIGKYKHTTDWVWVQEEPVNMGAWTYIMQNFNEVPLRVVARPLSGSPATGSSKFHVLRQRKIIEKAFGECICPMVEEECKMLCIGNRYQSFVKEQGDFKIDKISSKSISARKQLK
ncbi:MAG: 2-oxoglutarate dehydrogenase E1 component [Bacteroidota bacterium]|nr:2-oxoglutarate dehydrogenase E1 component [Bacteroidota bacterium]